MALKYSENNSNTYMYAILILLIIVGAVYFLSDCADYNFIIECLSIIAATTILFAIVRCDGEYNYGVSGGKDNGSGDISNISNISNSGIYSHDHSAEVLNNAESMARSTLGGGSSGDSKYMKMELMDPKHNLREIAKQMILLEDHMAHKQKRCVDCITKHYLMIEALLEEAITLDKTGEHIAEVEHIMQTIKPVMMEIIDNIKSGKMKNQSFADATYQKGCQALRVVRKLIGLKYVLNN